MVSTNVDKRILFADQNLISNGQSHAEVSCTDLGEVGPLRTNEVDVDQVRLGPEGSESETLHFLPPGEKSRETGVLLRD